MTLLSPQWVILPNSRWGVPEFFSALKMPLISWLNLSSIFGNMSIGYSINYTIGFENCEGGVSLPLSLALSISVSMSNYFLSYFLLVLTLFNLLLWSSRPDAIFVRLLPPNTCFKSSFSLQRLLLPWLDSYWWGEYIVAFFLFFTLIISFYYFRDYLRSRLS